MHREPNGEILRSLRSLRMTAGRYGSTPQFQSASWTPRSHWSASEPAGPLLRNGAGVGPAQG